MRTPNRDMIPEHFTRKRNRQRELRKRNGTKLARCPWCNGSGLRKAPYYGTCEYCDGEGAVVRKGKE